jgi:hypothetical protein
MSDRSPANHTAAVETPKEKRNKQRNCVILDGTSAILGSALGIDVSIRNAAAAQTEY